MISGTTDLEGEDSLAVDDNRPPWVISPVPKVITQRLNAKHCDADAVDQTDHRS